jgi:O-antigen/teichoic acid export membrane protein
MELLFVTVIAAGLGALIRSFLPGRSAFGLLLLPAVAASATAIVWVSLVYLGWKFDGTWIWVVSLAASIATAVVVGIVVPRKRREADARLLDELSRA